ncbi:hypothetical protein I7I53_01041 [Histoplasma capsulatum var. duboisii H88]|uniref:Uncharacterized protein n=1 Tax=Ajellomyces capsulatus (strain H88) TaxID=544711 RepID=A0A8A1LNX5_AJEC8|nr:hypothetical protein I7I53_01041 [Histoplasma capsulatum var. duboisii H88]
MNHVQWNWTPPYHQGRTMIRNRNVDARSYVSIAKSQNTWPGNARRNEARDYVQQRSHKR